MGWGVREWGLSVYAWFDEKVWVGLIVGPNFEV